MNSKALSTFPYFHLFYKTNCVPLLSKQKKKPHGNRQSLIAPHHQQSVTQNQQLAMIFMVFVLLLNYPKPPSKLGDHLPVVSITKLCYFFRSAIPLGELELIPVLEQAFKFWVWNSSKFKHDPYSEFALECNCNFTKFWLERFKLYWVPVSFEHISLSLSSIKLEIRVLNLIKLSSFE